MTTAIIAYSALGIGLIGSLWRIGRWFRLTIGAESRPPSKTGLGFQAAKAVGRTVFSPRIAHLLKSLVWEVLLQGHVLRQDWRRGIMHLGLFYGFFFLVIFHALDDFTSARLWGDYAPTLNPWRPGRNLGAALILLGVVFATLRRRADPLLRATRNRADRLALVLLAAIVLSGILLESHQIVSPSIFTAMVEDYMFSDDAVEVDALRAYWRAEFGAAATMSAAAGAGTLALGRELHADFCAACHDRPQSAFLSYPLSRLMKPLAAALEHVHFNTLLWHFHFLVSCLGLALLPFTKFFHLVAAPASLLVRAGAAAVAAPARLRPVRRAMGLDACTHCGVCSQHCAVAIVYRANPNPAILPSEKLGALKRWTSGGPAGQGAALAEGSYICTACGRCTTWCPSGIDLQDLWQASRADLMRRGFAPVDNLIRARGTAPPAPRRPAASPVPMTAGRRPATLDFTPAPEKFRACLQCTICTSVCPVVAVSDDLDLTPQQVMNLLRLQLREPALNARMVWDCVTCYQCQEHCPQGIRVADILYELRHEGHRRFKAHYPLNATDDIAPEGMP